jgi:hypothetical protein
MVKRKKQQIEEDETIALLASYFAAIIYYKLRSQFCHADDAEFERLCGRLFTALPDALALKVILERTARTDGKTAILIRKAMGNVVTR